MSATSNQLDGDEPRDASRPVRLGGATLGVERHVCAFFRSREDEYRVLLPFIKDGFERGEKAVHIVDPRRLDEHVRRLAGAGIDTTSAQASGQLELRGWADAHLQGGSFDQDRMLALIEAIRRRSREQGFPCIRFVTHMEWALEDRPGVEALIEYDAKANAVPFTDPVVCTHDLTRFGGDVVVEVMQTHPMIILGEILQENPFFVPPDAYAREVRERRAEELSTPPSMV
jgi:MEDS: MEthanogen/methylotroph, DcmR Sensory domain